MGIHASRINLKILYVNLRVLTVCVAFCTFYIHIYTISFYTKVKITITHIISGTELHCMNWSIKRCNTF